MEPHERILRWISQLPPPVPCPAAFDRNISDSNPRKRKLPEDERIEHHRLPSPPTSTKSPLREQPDYMADQASQDAAHAQRDGTPTSPDPKRLRVGGPGIDPDATPRGPRTQPINAEIAENDTESAASSDTGRVSNTALSVCSQTSLAKSSGSKKRSRQSSPRKQAALMEIEDIAETTTFTGRVAPPEQLKALNDRLERLNGTGKGILSRSTKASIQEAKEDIETQNLFEKVVDDFFEPDQTPSQSSIASVITRTADELGPTPSVSDVMLIWSNAEDCRHFKHFESQWNCAVHHLVLQTAFRDSKHLGFCSIAGAQIHPDYNQTGKRSHYNRKVDFCVFLKQDTPALRVAARTSPINSVNHTDYPALLSRPIFFSIETKDSGDKWVDATNQVTAWLVAQWDFLDDQVLRAQGVDTSKGSRPTTSAAALSGLVFLPGIIVQGHNWHFVAVTRSADGRTRYWENTLIGTTQSIEGIYKVVAALQMLGCWAQEVYWPWLQRAVLRQTDGSSQPVIQQSPHVDKRQTQPGTA
ncbi:hypothetical protein CGCF415_v015357 [Colletotrichum fructicola]|nr:hypothetical protein CGCF415_v015357 [Colletotrichum fructicola]KAF4920554.1 hypothetical protein CGCF245_v015709 [Colletotrichum fructicola]KAF5482764.1 hypothetical protein CGCF413_v015638 [Colletotrichum fructicola]